MAYLRLSLALLALPALVALNGCAFATQQVPNAAIYADVTYPSWYKGVSNDGPGSKKGISESSAVLGIFASGDSGIEAACKKGGITKIKTVDHEYMSILMGIYWRWTTIVTGD